MFYCTAMRPRPLLPLTTALQCILLVCAVLFAAPQSASANSEPPSIHDARHTGTGGVGVAFAEGPAAIFHNPAGMQSVDELDLTLGFSLLTVFYNAPFGGYGSEQDSPPLFGPLPFLGAAFRVHPRVVLGLALYISVGFGGRFTDIFTITDGVDSNGVERPPLQLTEPVSQTVQLFIAELAIPVQFQVTDDLSVGIALRLPYGNFRAEAFQDIVGRFAPIEQSVAGVGIPGIYLGGQWRVSEHVTLGLAYRSKVRVGMSGSVFAPQGLGIIAEGQEVTLNARTDWYVPHMIRGGVAFHLCDQRLMLSLEGRIQFHKSANERLLFEITNPGEANGGLSDAVWNVAVATGLQNFASEFQWQNVYVVGFAGEYAVTESFRWRLAATWGTIATVAETTTPFSPPPSNRAWQLATGFGVDLGRHLTVDIGFAIGTNPPAYVPQDNAEFCGNDDIVKGGCNGLYSLTSYFLGLSATYHL